MGEIMNKLENWKEKYERARSNYGDDIAFFKRTYEQYEGKRQHEGKTGSKAPKCLYNFSKELIESQIDSNVPMPKVESNSISPKKKERASRIEALLRSEKVRLKLSEFNDLDERLCKAMGLDFLLIEWNNLLSTHTTVGAVSVKQILPSQLIPQTGVYEIEEMDYIFLTFEDTKERLKERYGKSVIDESTDPQSETDSNATDLVTQVICFYKNSMRGVGCFSWAGDTILIDDDRYNARGKQKCIRCEKIRATGEKTCTCGSSEWEKNTLEYEELTEDIDTGQVDEQGVPIIIPATEDAKDEYGEPLMEEYEEQAIDQYTGEPMYEQVFDEQMNFVGEKPLTNLLERNVMTATKIPYYVPREFPVAVRKNISIANCLRGDSDCETIWELQDSTNKLLTKAEKRGINSGTIIAKVKEIKYNPSNEEFAVLDVDTMANMNGIKPINIQFDASQVENQAMSNYMKAKSLLGITESSQGKPDTTAMSGVAKQQQIARAEGRQLSKRVMKDMFYAKVFETIFHYYLAYSDGKIVYKTTDEYGETVEKEFDRYFFLDQDEYGNWHYDDDYIFSVDPTGAMFSDKQFQLEDMRSDLGLGMYGDPQDPNTKLIYWKNKAAMNYPNAKTMIAYWQKKVDEIEEQKRMQLEQQMQGQLMQQGGIMQGVTDGGLPPPLSAPPGMEGVM